jgi:hypothetical protein
MSLKMLLMMVLAISQKASRILRKTKPKKGHLWMPSKNTWIRVVSQLFEMLNSNTSLKMNTQRVNIVFISSLIDLTFLAVPLAVL